MTRRLGRLTVGLLVAGMALGGVTVVAADDGTSVTSVVNTAESTESMLETAALTEQQLGSGLLFGLGVGLILGSVGTYYYWEGRLG